MTLKIQVVVIEDEPEIRKFLNSILSNHGYEAKFAENAKDGINLISLYPPELIILDLSLPDIDGIEVIKNIRAWLSVPIIVLSARGKEEDKVNALELGADDYITKPFNSGELLARLKVAIRHSQKNTDPNLKILKIGDLTINLEKRLVLLKDIEIHLTKIEYKLLICLVKNAGKVLTHKQLLKEVWGKNSLENNHYLRIYTKNLRAKLGDDPMQPKYIITEAGVGYKFKE